MRLSWRLLRRRTHARRLGEIIPALAVLCIRQRIRGCRGVRCWCWRRAPHRRAEDSKPPAQLEEKSWQPRSGRQKILRNGGVSGGLGCGSLGRQIRDGHGEHGLRIPRASQKETNPTGGGSRLMIAVIFNTMLSQNLLQSDFWQIITASGAAGRVYSAVDDFVEFHRGGACVASFHTEAGG